MGWFLTAVAALVLLGLYLNWDLSRKQGRAFGERQLREVTDAHAQVAARVVELFAAVARAREGEGRTQAAFAAVERAFAHASEVYGPLDQQVEGIKAAFAARDYRPLRAEGQAVREGLAAMHPILDELQAQLDRYRSQWRAAPVALDAARSQVDELKALAARAEAELGFALPASKQVESLEQFLARAEAEGQANPVAAAQKAEDLQVRLPAVAQEVGMYVSAAGAIRQAQAEVAAAQAGPGAAVPSLATHLERAAGALAELRPLLQAANLDRFQQRLLDIQNCLRAVRQGLRQHGGGAVH